MNFNTFHQASKAYIYGLYTISNFSSSVIIWHLLNKKWYSKWYSRVSAKVEVLFFMLKISRKEDLI
nr:MAG TPA: hypothetical protein [Caudoviricetes sp.]